MQSEAIVEGEYGKVTHKAAAGNAFRALDGRVLGAGDPPNSSASKGCSVPAWSTKSDTIEGTLYVMSEKAPGSVNTLSLALQRWIHYEALLIWERFQPLRK